MTAPRVRVYVTRTCFYCKQARALLDGKGVAYEAIDCSDDAAVREWLVEATTRRTVPQIFFDDVPIGGCDDLYALEKRGELDALLRGEARATSIAEG